MNAPVFLIVQCGSPRKVWGMSPQSRTQAQITELFPDAVIQKNPETFAGDRIILLRDDVIYSDNFLAGLTNHTETLFTGEDDTPVAANVEKDRLDKTASWLVRQSDPPSLPRLAPDKAGLVYNDALRRRSIPYAVVVTKDSKGEIERRLYMESYKGVTDIVTKYLWPIPAYHVTRFCAKAGISPNMVTSVGAILMLAALYLFWNGQYGPGLLAGWVMTFLDTVDGKLARVTLTSSKWGNIFDHGIDLIHPPFWYIAWGYGLAQYGTSFPDGWLAPVLVIMFASYVAGRLCEGYFIGRFGIHIHIWRQFDSTFRLISARRNPALIILTLFWIFGRPDIGLLIVTAWHVLTVVVHLVQILQAEIKRRQNTPVTSWLKA